MADDFLDNKPMLALMPPGSEEEDDTFSIGNVTQQTGMTSKSRLSDKSKVSINKRNVGKYGALLKQRQVDRLDPESRAKLEAMVKEIDENLEELQREKEEYMRHDGQSSSPSKVSKLGSAPNVYAFEGETKARMDEIESKLRDWNPTAQESVANLPPTLGGVQLPDSKGDMNATSSNFSVFSAASKRSNFTTITLQTNITSLGGKQKALPKEGVLRDKAMKRMTQAQLKEIEDHLRNLRRTDDLSYSSGIGGKSSEEAEGKKVIDQETLLRLIDECKEEEDRLALLQIMPADKQTQETMAVQQENAQRQIAKLDEISSKLTNAGSQIEHANALQLEAGELEEQLVSSQAKMLNLLEEAEKEKAAGLVKKFDDLVEKTKNFTSHNIGKIDQVAQEMSQIEHELDKKEALITKLRQEFEENTIPEGVELPQMKFTKALQPEFTGELPKDDEPDESTSLSIRMALGETKYEEEKDENIERIMADIKEFEKQ